MLVTATDSQLSEDVLRDYILQQYARSLPVDLTAYGKSHSSKPIVSSELLRQMLTGEIASELIPVSNQRIGLVLKGATFDRIFSLVGCGSQAFALPHISFIECRFYQGLDLSESYIEGLTILGCVIGPKGSRISGASYRRAAEAEMRAGKSQNAISARGSHFISSVYLGALRVHSASKLDFSHATIGGDCELHDVSAIPFNSTYANDKLEDQASHNISQNGSESLPEAGIAGIQFCSSNIAGDLTIAGVKIHSDSQSLHASRLRVGGDVRLCYDESGLPCEFIGEINLMSARLDGQFIMNGVRLSARPPSSEEDRPIALIAENAMFGADFFVRADSNHADRVSRIEGQLNLIAAKIGGDLQITGTLSSCTRFRAINAKQTVIVGDVRLGWLSSQIIHRCHIDGEVDFSNSKIRGKFSVRGDTDIRISRCQQPSELARKRSQKYSVKLTSAEIAGDILFEGTSKYICRIEGLGLIGARVDGRLMITGAKIYSSPAGVNCAGIPVSQKAIVANGAIIRGGIICEHDEFTSNRPLIRGDLRFRNVQVNGPVIFKGVCMGADASGLGVAFDATNATFSGDVLFIHHEKKPCIVIGEIRLWGATIEGVLKLEGVRVTSLCSGSTLDCYTAEVKKGILLLGGAPNQAAPGVSPDLLKSEFRGIVGLVNVRTPHLTIGMGAPSGQGAPIAAVVIIGSILLKQARMSAATNLTELEIRPCVTLPQGYLRGRIEDRLGKRDIVDHRCIISATHTDFGAELHVRLTQMTSGVIDMFGATVGTIGGTEFVESWGELPMPDCLHDGKLGVTVNLDGFQYQRIHDRGPAPLSYEKVASSRHWLFYIGKMILGVPSHQQLGARLSWLERQPQNYLSPKEFVPFPYRQLAKVYKEQGQVALSNEFVKARRWRQIWRDRVHQRPHKLMEGPFGFAFGFGYSPLRAIATVGILYFASCSFTALTLSTGQTISSEPHLVSTSDRSVMPSDRVCNREAVLLEALKIVLPFTRNDGGSGCSLSKDAPARLHLFKLLLQLLSWIVFPLAALTLSGLLRERYDSRVSMESIELGRSQRGARCELASSQGVWDHSSAKPTNHELHASHSSLIDSAIWRSFRQSLRVENIGLSDKPTTRPRESASSMSASAILRLCRIS